LGEITGSIDSMTFSLPRKIEKKKWKINSFMWFCDSSLLDQDDPINLGWHLKLVEESRSDADRRASEGTRRTN
jgi:hypothetical protein